MQRLMRAHGNTELATCAEAAEPFQSFRAWGKHREALFPGWFPSLFCGFIVFRFRRQGVPALVFTRKGGTKRTKPQGGSQKTATGESYS